MMSHLFLTDLRAAPSSSPEERPQRVLVVEDDPDTADTLADLLSLYGYEVRTAYSGVAALELAAGFLPHVVLSDLAMPGMDGYALCGRLREQPELHACRFVALSGLGDEVSVARCREAGFHLHLLKPGCPGALRRCIEGPGPRPA